MASCSRVITTRDVLQCGGSVRGLKCVLDRTIRGTGQDYREGGSMKVSTSMKVGGLKCVEIAVTAIRERDPNTKPNHGEGLHTTRLHNPYTYPAPPTPDHGEGIDATGHDCMGDLT